MILIRSYFNKSYFKRPAESVTLTVTQGQLIYEFNHLLGKLKVRDKALYDKLKNTKTIVPHPMFNIIKGGPEAWEIIKK